MDYNEVKDNARFHGSTALEMKKAKLYGEIDKCLSACERKIEVIEDSGLSTTPTGKAQLEIYKDMADCYTDLLNTSARNRKELEDLEWLFNGGKLREEEEIQKRYRLRKTEEYMETQYVCDRYNTTMYEADVESLTRPLIVFLTFFILQLFATFMERLNYSYFPGMVYTVDVHDYAVLYVIGWPFAFIPAYVIVKGLEVLLKGMAEWKLFKKTSEAGGKASVSPGVIANAAIYGIVLAKVFKKGKKRK